MDKLDELLQYLEERIDPDHMERVLDMFRKCNKYEPVDRILMHVNYPVEGFQEYPYSETVQDFGKMMYNQLLSCVCTVESKDYGLPMIRANYGVGTLPSLFGLKSTIINENLPWVDHAGSADALKRIIDAGVPDLNTGFGRRLTLTHEYYAERLEKYPKCKKYIRVYHPDFQGPFDVAHLIWGSDIYMAFYDDEKMVRDLLSLVTETYIKLMKRTKTEINDEVEGGCYHWSALFGGNIVLRNDSSVNLSRDMYINFVRGCDERIAEAFGCASMHFCGRADHWVFDLPDMRHLRTANFGYMPNVEFGEKYLDFIMPKFQERGVAISQYTLAEQELPTFDFDKYRTGVNYVVSFKNKASALSALEQYK